MIFTYFLLAVGLAAIVKGADFLIDGSIALAKRAHVSYMTIGLTVVAFGTSMPEMVVSVFSALKGIGGVSVGNIVGSNISNILLILGISSIIAPIAMRKEIIKREVVLGIIGAVLLVLLFFDGRLSRLDSLVLFAYFAVFFFMSWKNRGIGKADEGIAQKDMSGLKASLFVFTGIALLFLGGRWTIGSVTDILRAFHVSEILISSTVIAVGTSLPELVASITAVFKKNDDIAIGNIVGSNIFNIGFILGMTAIIAPITFDWAWMTDLFILVGVSSLLLALMFIKRKSYLTQWKGTLFIFCYALYLYFLIRRG